MDEAHSVEQPKASESRPRAEPVDRPFWTADRVAVTAWIAIACLSLHPTSLALWIPSSLAYDDPAGWVVLALPWLIALAVSASVRREHPWWALGTLLFPIGWQAVLFFVVYSLKERAQ